VTPVVLDVGLEGVAVHGLLGIGPDGQGHSHEPAVLQQAAGQGQGLVLGHVLEHVSGHGQIEASQQAPVHVAGVGHHDPVVLGRQPEAFHIGPPDLHAVQCTPERACAESE
jgi:hypothetical protein